MANNATKLPPIEFYRADIPSVAEDLSRRITTQSHMKTERSNARAGFLWPMSCGQKAEVFRLGRHVRFGPRARGTATSAIQAADIRNKMPHDEKADFSD
jgi:hypothetical protein